VPAQQTEAPNLSQGLGEPKIEVDRLLWARKPVFKLADKETLVQALLVAECNGNKEISGWS